MTKTSMTKANKANFVGWSLVVFAVGASLVVVGQKTVDKYLNSKLNVLSTELSEEVSNLSVSLVGFEHDLVALKSEVKGAKVEPAPEQSTEPAQPTTGGGGLVNLNTASLSQLMSLPGIGQSYATRIMEARPFNSINEVTQVKGIGPKTFEKIKAQIEI